MSTKDIVDTVECPKGHHGDLIVSVPILLGREFHAAVPIDYPRSHGLDDPHGITWIVRCDHANDDGSFCDLQIDATKLSKEQLKALLEGFPQGLIDGQW